ncbi:unnamed protein product [Brassica oleracea]
MGDEYSSPISGASCCSLSNLLNFILPEKGNMNRYGLHSIVLINGSLNSFSPTLSTIPHSMPLPLSLSRVVDTGSICASIRVSSTESACISVSGTYWPPNFPNLPNESGRCHRVGSDPAVIRTGGSLALVQ